MLHTRRAREGVWLDAQARRRGIRGAGRMEAQVGWWAGEHADMQSG